MLKLVLPVESWRRRRGFSRGRQSGFNGRVGHGSGVEL
jgi:hypothetical protein